MRYAIDGRTSTIAPLLYSAYRVSLADTGESRRAALHV
jgi:hypothetical protein